MLRSAGGKLGKELLAVRLGELKIPYVTNVTAEYVTDSSEIRELLTRQVYSPVRWEQSIRKMIAQDVDTFVEIGPGRTLTGFLRENRSECDGISGEYLGRFKANHGGIMAEKTAIVTGASRGIGRAIALELAGKGYKVILNYCGSKVRAEQAAEEICAAGGQAKAVQCDVSDYIACETFINNIIKEEGRIDVLVNNAGITRDGLLYEDVGGRFRCGDQFHRSLKGCFHCMRFVFQADVKAEKRKNH